MSWCLQKWHLGYCDERYSPLYRGFDSFMGYLNGAEDYWEHTRGDDAFSGLDFRNGSGTDTLPASHNQSWGVYSSVIFGAEVARIATHHGQTEATTTPLFVYFPFQSVHAPLEAPQSYLDEYHEVNDTARQQTCAMISAMDDAVAVALAGYKQAGLWEDTVTVFSTDKCVSRDRTRTPLRSSSNPPRAWQWRAARRDRRPQQLPIAFRQSAQLGRRCAWRRVGARHGQRAGEGAGGQRHSRADAHNVGTAFCRRTEVVTPRLLTGGCCAQGLVADPGRARWG